MIEALRGADIYDSITNDDCPKKWYDATDGKVKDALKQWRGSLLWRRNKNIDSILMRPQAKFFLIKRLIPHAWLGNDYDGNLVTFEHYGNLNRNIKDLLAAGVTSEDFAYHVVFLNEYWIRNKLSSTGRLHKILDFKGLSVPQVTLQVLKYLEPLNRCMQQYPEMLVKVIVINAPSSFRFIWRIVTPLLAKKTTEKIRITTQHLALEDIWASCPKEILPTECNGDLDGPFESFPLERALADFVRNLNENHGIQNEDD